MEQLSNAVKPVIPTSKEPTAQHGSGLDTDRQDVLQLQSSVIQQGDTLRKQVSRYLQALNTLLLLYIMYAVSKRSLISQVVH